MNPLPRILQAFSAERWNFELSLSITRTHGCGYQVCGTSMNVSIDNSLVSFLTMSGSDTNPLELILGRKLDFRDEPVAESHGVSIIDIPFYRDDLDTTAGGDDYDKYDTLVARVDPDTARAMWITWGLTALLSTLLTFLVFFAIIIHKRVRQAPFNVYLIALMLPDMYYNGSCAVQCIWNVRVGHMKSVTWCHWQSHVVMFGI